MRSRPAPMTAEQVTAYIAELVASNQNRAARIRMAELAIKIGNVTEEGRDVWRKFLAAERADSNG